MCLFLRLTFDSFAVGLLAAGSFCPVDAKLQAHWDAAREAACAAYMPAVVAPKCPVTLVLPPGSNPATELTRPYANPNHLSVCPAIW